MTQAIRVEGLREFERSLRTLDSDLSKGLRIALNDVSDLVISDAQPRIPRRSGRAARSLRKRSTRTAVRVAAGGRAAPYYPWLDFGGRVGRGRTVRRAFLQEGRYIYRAYFGLRDSGRFQERLAAALAGVARQAGLEVT